MENEILTAGLTDIPDQSVFAITDPIDASGGTLQSVGPGLYRFRMPDGSWVLVNEAGQIVG